MTQASSQSDAGKPVIHYSTSGGWTTLGHAKSLSGAAAIIRRHLSDASKVLIEKAGFSLNVFERTDLAVELNGGPKGYVWTIGKTIKA